jgi:hypothetical protein
LARRPLTGPWFRAIRPQFFQTALAFAHTTTIPGRFNGGSIQHPGFPVLYLAEDQIVALFEVDALLGSPLPGKSFLPNANQPWTTVPVDVRLSRVVDLNRVSQRRLIETTVQELTGDWRGYLLRNPNQPFGPPYWTNVPTQRLGAALHAVKGLEGFLTYSAKVPTRRNLVIFPTKLRKGGYVRFTDPATKQVYSIP